MREDLCGYLRARFATPSICFGGLVTLWIVTACSGGSGGFAGTTGEQEGQSCSLASQCYPGLNPAALAGQVTCLSKVQNGYCTHTCRSDSDCCSVPGECLTGLTQVCAPFESSGMMYCFLGCSAADIGAAPDAGTTDSTAYCQTWANASFTCRSTGGGSNNRKFCGP
jgi:hypothetical protein